MTAEQHTFHAWRQEVHFLRSRLTGQWGWYWTCREAEYIYRPFDPSRDGELPIYVSRSGLCRFVGDAELFLPGAAPGDAIRRALQHRGQYHFRRGQSDPDEWWQPWPGWWTPAALPVPIRRRIA